MIDSRNYNGPIVLLNATFVLYMYL